MDAEGEVIAPHNGPRTVDGFKTTVKSVRAWTDLKDKEELTTGEQVDLLLARIALGKVDFEEATEAAKGIEADEAQSKEIAQALLPLEISSHLPQGRRPTPADLQNAGKAFAGMMDEGRMPDPSEQQTVQTFYICMLQYAEAELKVDLFETALGKLRETFGDNPQAARFFEQQDARFERLKARAEAAEEADGAEEEDGGMGGGR